MPIGSVVRSDFFPGQLNRSLETSKASLSNGRSLLTMRPSVEEKLRMPHHGRCRICSRNGRFTKEHVPPRAARNSGTVIVSSPEALSHPKRVSMRPQHTSSSGIFLFSLCDRCNSKTGSRYGADYSSFIDRVVPHAVPANVNERVAIDLAGLHPLRIVKQAASMILSTSNPTSFNNHEFVSAPGRSKKDLEGIQIAYPETDRQREIYDQLRRFVRQRDSTDFPPDVRVYLFANVGRRIGFRTGIFTRINLTTKSAVFAIATGLYPIHWIFTFGPLDEGILEVSAWTNYGYKEPFTEAVAVPMRWLEGRYPLDFRSPQDLNVFNFIHSMEMEGFVPSIIDDKDRLLEDALFFARTLGKKTREGYLISSFPTGTFYESGPVNGWLPDGDRHDGIKILEFRLKSHN